MFWQVGDPWTTQWPGRDRALIADRCVHTNHTSVRSEWLQVTDPDGPSERPTHCTVICPFMPHRVGSVWLLHLMWSKSTGVKLWAEHKPSSVHRKRFLSLDQADIILSVSSVFNIFYWWFGLLGQLQEVLKINWNQSPDQKRLCGVKRPSDDVCVWFLF